MGAFETMIQGDRYWINDPQLIEIRLHTRELVDEFNQLAPRAEAERQHLFTQLFAEIGDDVHVEKPIHIDYGCNIHLGHHVFINFGWTVLDCAKVTIGDHVFIGPHVAMYTANHPLDKTTRANHIGDAEPITIGSNVWIGGNCIILPGVTIGDDCVIGAGSLVTTDIESGMLAMGQPCRAVRPVLEGAR
ncbi:sugar O-acetyltransferase [Celerinatantimonas yamalensis]|uniref:Sugar O-acetyltransferase n=1 Tax=Celerinatantimonas yamalensis TaxID=559956 RepID=A0ABW9G9J4_9GAMM